MYNLQTFSNPYFIDPANDNMAYESLGPWSQLMEDSQGTRFRIWKYTEFSTGQTIQEKYPFNWEDYFSRPSIYPQTPLGRFSYGRTTYSKPLISISSSLLLHTLDHWYVMGYLRSRGALRLAVIVRECPFILIKLSKFNSLISHCAICPLNWMYCSPIDSQRLVILFFPPNFNRI